MKVTNIEIVMYEAVAINKIPFELIENLPPPPPLLERALAGNGNPPNVFDIISVYEVKERENKERLA
jgi:hypothetical protein